MNIDQVYTTIAASIYLLIVGGVLYLWFIRERSLLYCMRDAFVTDDWTSGIGKYFWTRGNRIVLYTGIVEDCPTFLVIPSILGNTISEHKSATIFNTVQWDEDKHVQYNAMGCAWGHECDIQDEVTPEEFAYFVLRGE